ncbi:hypothetical protein Bbelb_053620 [Branchiostoma belcheri]|nr:hypothetical protein Bbelb_053620 [Branchiostoma belcheri]
MATPEYGSSVNGAPTPFIPVGPQDSPDTPLGRLRINDLVYCCKQARLWREYDKQQNAEQSPDGRRDSKAPKACPPSPRATASTDTWVESKDAGGRRGPVSGMSIRCWPRTLGTLNAELPATPYRCLPPTSELSRQKRSRTLTTDASVEEADGRVSDRQVQQTTMRTPTLVVAIILAMAMAGDSANIERLLRHLRLLAGEETIDEATMTHTKGKSVDTEETQLLDLVKKLSLESKEPEPIDFSGEKVPDVEENYDMAGLGDQNPTSEEGEAEGDEVTEQNYDQSETGEEYSTSTEDGSEQAPDFRQNYDMTGFQNQDPTSEGAEEEGSTDVEQNYDVAKIGEKDSTLKEDEQAPDVGQNYGMTGREDQDPTSKEVGGEKGPDVEQKYDMTGREDPDQSLRVPWRVRGLNAIHLLSLATMDYELPDFEAEK